MGWVLVTPARNEADRLPQLAASLAAQQGGLIDLWVVVDDGSTDGTAAVAAALDLPFPVELLRRENTGGLSGASELGAFITGADAGLAMAPSAARVMKCDADLRLAPDYLERVARVGPEVGVCTGVVAGSAELEQRTYTLGQLKAYTPEAYALVREMPRTLGWDVADEVLLRLRGWDVQVVPAARATTSRRTGSSEGLLAGRRRNGTLSRWLGYHPVYFALRVVRFAFRRPFGLSAVALLQGYLTAGPSPYDEEIRSAFRATQASKLRALAAHPVRWTRQTYFSR
jgi:glycosyltransferase involved in cell wall biosynthesis